AALKAEVGADVIDVAVEERESGAARVAIEELMDLGELPKGELRGTETGYTLFVPDGPRNIAVLIRGLDRAGVRFGAVSVSRSIRGILREPELFLFALVIPVFFFVVQVGALGDVAKKAMNIPNYAAFQLPISILFAAASTSGGNALVLDISNGYWDKLSVTPVRRSALVVGTLFGELFAV